MLFFLFCNILEWHIFSGKIETFFYYIRTRYLHGIAFHIYFYIVSVIRFDLSHTLQLYLFFPWCVFNLSSQVGGAFFFPANIISRQAYDC